MPNNFNTQQTDMLIDLGISVRAYNYCLRKGIRTASQLLEFYKDCGNVIPPGINAGRTTITELAKLCESLIAREVNVGLNDNPIDDIKNWGLSARAYNFCQASHLLSRKDIVSYYCANGKVIPPMANVGRKTICELETLCESFIKDDPTLVPDLACISEKSCTDLEFLGLTEEENSFIDNFKENHGHLPILWFVSKLIETNDDMKCFASVYGICNDRSIKTAAELADEMGVTQSRIGQRIVKGHDAIFSLNSNTSKRASKLGDLFSEFNIRYLVDLLNDADVASSSDSTMKLLASNFTEHTSFSPSFILRLVSSLSDKYTCIGEFERNKVNPPILLIKNDIVEFFDFSRFCIHWEEFTDSLSKNRDINIREYIEDSPDWNRYSSLEVNRVLRACKMILLYRYGIYDEDADDILHLTPSKIDLDAVAYGIIEGAKAPLTLNEIAEVINKQYPTKNFSEDNIKFAIRDDKRIKFQRDGSGRTKYLLASFDLPSSVREAIVRILEQSDCPVPIDEIVDFVMLHFPSSSKNSVRTTMLNDGRSRFIQYEGGRFGLASKTYSEEYLVLSDNSRATYGARIIALKTFLNDHHQLPYSDSDIPEEASLARWMERNNDKKDVRDLVSGYGMSVWKESCNLCEKYILSHKGKLPLKDTEPRLYKWLLNAAADFNEGKLNQEQKKLYLHLTMIIKNRHA